jgi:hypothetical protein
MERDINEIGGAMFEVGNAIGGAVCLFLLTLGVLRARQQRKDDDDKDEHEFI